MPPSLAPATFRLLPPGARLFIAALRAGQADLDQASTWEESEILALCDVLGLRRCAAARLGACIAFLLREATAVPELLPPGSDAVSGAEVVLAAAVVAPEDETGPSLLARRVVQRWLPAHRRVQGAALLALAAQDLAAWRGATR
jgi:hypothetical protein